MVDGFNVSKEQALFLKFFNPEIEFDFDKFDYQISSFTTDFEQSKREGGFMGLYPSPADLVGFPDLERVKSK